MVALAACLASGPFRVARLARTVRLLASEGRYEEAREPLRRWLEERPRSAEALYYKARLELAAERPAEALAAIEEARRLGFDRDQLWCLAAVMQARSGRFAEAEPGLVRAYRLNLEPQADVAKELARVYLSTYRLSQASEPLERWRALAPEDPRPYLWRNEIASRSDGMAGTVIENYRAALERDPSLDEVRLRLADQLAKQSRFAEADEEYATCLRRNPRDAAALVGLGRGALRRGDFEDATRHFEAALAVDPRRPEALKELAQIDLRRGRHKDACARLAILTEVEPFDSDIRYSFAQALRLVGDDARSRAEGERAARLRQDNDRIDELRKVLLRQPGDVNTRYEVARWMLEHGHQSEGLEWAALILRAEPGHAPTHRLLAEHYQRQGNTGLANYHRMMVPSAQDGRAEPLAAKPEH
jgi:tetratricopeptide (TPR) repeat protein